MHRTEQAVRHGRNCPICAKPVELKLITYNAPFRCQSCGAMLDISSFYAWLTHALSTTLAFLLLWQVVHFDFWFAAIGSLILNFPLKALIRPLTKPIIPLEPSDVVA
ncbi:MAG: hypothetical protein WA211_13800 [Candidatus Acidiferrales bacterium]